MEERSSDQSHTVLLHVCCIVCACWPLDFLTELGCKITVLYDNSNIWPKEEYDHRYQEVLRYIHERFHDSIEVIAFPYDYEKYKKEVIPNRKDDPEGWTSCFNCYAHRLKHSFDYAEEHHYDFTTSVLTFSRQKDSQKINEISEQLCKKFTYTKYLHSDFKKANGSLNSDRLCTEYNVYRQDYCGCEYSYYERHPETANSEQ